MENTKLASLIRTPACPSIIDVRSALEFKQGHIPGAMHVPLFKLLLGLGKLPAERSVHAVLVCEHGRRAELARSILKRRGYERLETLEGHMHAWKRRGLPLE